MHIIFDRIGVAAFIKVRKGVTCMTGNVREGPAAAVAEAGRGGVNLRDILWPLEALTPRERAVFVEYHYWKTHMKEVATSHRISLGRAYTYLYTRQGRTMPPVC